MKKKQLELEFTIGDQVTYKPYGVKHAVEITGIIQHPTYIEYRIASKGDSVPKKGWGKHFPTTLHTTGKSILESKLYNEAR